MNLLDLGWNRQTDFSVLVLLVVPLVLVLPLIIPWRVSKVKYYEVVSSTDWFHLE